MGLAFDVSGGGFVLSIQRVELLVQPVLGGRPLLASRIFLTGTSLRRLKAERVGPILQMHCCFGVSELLEWIIPITTWRHCRRFAANASGHSAIRS
jgi:hypothetical protein